MEIVYIIVLLLTLVISAISIASYFSNRSGLKQEHAAKMAELQPVRTMELSDVEKFGAVYKKKVPTGTPVYRVKGSVGYISIRAQGSESREYAIGGIRIAPRSVQRLGKNDIGVRLNEYLPDTDAVQTALDDLNVRIASNEIPEDKVAQMVETIEDKLCNHTIEFAFTKEDVARAPAFITAIDDIRIV